MTTHICICMYVCMYVYICIYIYVYIFKRSRSINFKVSRKWFYETDVKHYQNGALSTITNIAKKDHIDRFGTNPLNNGFL